MEGFAAERDKHSDFNYVAFHVFRNLRIFENLKFIFLGAFRCGLKSKSIRMVMQFKYDYCFHFPAVEM